MEVRAKLNKLRMGATKGRAVAALVRRKNASEAIDILKSSPKAAARPLRKLIESAVANAQEKNSRQSAGIDLDNLYIKTITVDEATRGWRIRPRAQGRAYWIAKATSHVTVVLDER